MAEIILFYRWAFPDRNRPIWLLLAFISLRGRTLFPLFLHTIIQVTNGRPQTVARRNNSLQNFLSLIDHNRCLLMAGAQKTLNFRRYLLAPVRSFRRLALRCGWMKNEKKTATAWIERESDWGKIEAAKNTLTVYMTLTLMYYIRGDMYTYVLDAQTCRDLSLPTFFLPPSSAINKMLYHIHCFY